MPSLGILRHTMPLDVYFIIICGTAKDSFQASVAVRLFQDYERRTNVTPACKENSKILTFEMQEGVIWESLWILDAHKTGQYL